MKRIILFFVASFFLINIVQGERFYPEEMIYATYNLRLANRDDSISGNGWGQRFPYLTDLIKFHGFDMFGTQEGYKFQLEDMKGNLPEFEYIGVGRDDGIDGGEHAAIFYNKNKFELLDHGDFWLSETPDSVSFGWDAACRRVCTWGKFRHKANGFIFLCFNLHMDHIGIVARAESAKLILKKINEFEKGIPVILSGDFNVDQNSESYKLLNESGIMKDAYETAEFVYANNGTFNNFNTQAYTKERIDHIFLSPEFRVNKYGILTDTYRLHTEGDETEELANFPKDVSLSTSSARVPSDHFPVMIRIQMKEEE